MQNRVNWYPGHMFKAKKELISELKNIDVIIEVIDSRVAISSHNLMLDEITKNKQKLLVFSKYDLVEAKDLERIIQVYKDEGYNTICANIKNGQDNIKILKKIDEVSKPIVDKFKNKGIVKKISVAVMGMPNVGKSTLINFLVNKNKVIVANKPGVTKAQQWVSINENLQIMDTPGILVPKIENNDDGYKLVLCQLIKDEVVNLDDVAVYLLGYLYDNYNEQLQARYKININEFDIETIYNDIAKSIGALLKGAQPDYERVTQTLINDFRNQKFSKVILER